MLVLSELKLRTVRNERSLHFRSDDIRSEVATDIEPLVLEHDLNLLADVLVTLDEITSKIDGRVVGVRIRWTYLLMYWEPCTKSQVKFTGVLWAFVFTFCMVSLVNVRIPLLVLYQSPRRSAGYVQAASEIDDDKSVTGYWYCTSLCEGRQGKYRLHLK